jgi:hypothetical protein
MRRLLSLALGTASVAGAAAHIHALEPAASRHAPQASSQPVRQAIPGQIRREVAVLRLIRLDAHVPPADSFLIGGRTVSAGETVRGVIAVARGPLEVRGRVEGNALALHGDIVVQPGGVITGDAVAIGGHVRARGGIVGGDIKSVSGLFPISSGSGRAEAVGAGATWQAIKVVLGWFAILLVIGIGVLVFAEPALDSVVEALHQRFGRAFWYGLLAQLATIPALLVILLALVLTVVGILLIPFAVVAYVVALAGLLTLGFLAVARFTGAALARTPITTRARSGPGVPARGASLRPLIVGLVFYLGLWLAAAAFTWSPLIGSILRAAALAVTWVAVTLGLGAVVASRLVAWRPQSARAAAPGAADPMVWQTPTPVTGVAAARRPVSTARSEAS